TTPSATAFVSQVARVPASTAAVEVVMVVHVAGALPLPYSRVQPARSAPATVPCTAGEATAAMVVTGPVRCTDRGTGSSRARRALMRPYPVAVSKPAAPTSSAEARNAWRTCSGEY